MQPFFERDSLNIATYGGFIGNLNCKPGSSCPESFELHIRQQAAEPDGQANVNNDLQIGKYGVRGPATQVFQMYKASFTSLSLPLGVTHQWYFGDGSTSSAVIPVHYYTNLGDSVVEPMLSIYNSATGCNSQIQYEVNFKMPCESDIFYDNDSTTIALGALPAASTELFDLGLGFLPLDGNNPIPQDSVFRACVIATFANGCEARKCENIVTDSTVVSCVANFDVNKEIITSPDARNFGEMTLIHTMSDGKTYRSDSYPQPAGSFFEILKVDEYLQDVNGNPTKRLLVRYALRLYGTSPTDAITVQSDTSSFSVSYQ
jgi:hypothetical protein